MQRIRKFLYENNKKSPVLVPRVIHDMVTRYIMQFIILHNLDKIVLVMDNNA